LTLWQNLINFIVCSCCQVETPCWSYGQPEKKMTSFWKLN
jgi:hypothetical protein